MFENRSEEERKKIFWIFVIGITLIIVIVWIILFAKGLVLDSKDLAEKKPKNNSQQNTSSITGELKNAINEFNKLDIKGKISGIKDELKNINSEVNQNENQSLNANQNVNQEQALPQTNEQNQIEKPIDTNTQGNLNSSTTPRLPIEN